MSIGLDRMATPSDRVATIDSYAPLLHREDKSIEEKIAQYRGIGKIVVARAGYAPDEVFIDGLQRERWSYVTHPKIAWFDPAIYNPDTRRDVDEYDQNGNTLHLAALPRNIEIASASEVLMSLRMTRAETLEKSLSFGMFKSRPDLQKEASNSPEAEEINAAGEAELLIDITRVFAPNDSDHSSSGHTRLVALLELYGYAAGIALRDVPDELKAKVRFVFTSNEDMMKVLSRFSIEPEIITHGKLISETGAEDTEDSYLNMLRPSTIEARLRDRMAHAETAGERAGAKFALTRMLYGIRQGMTVDEDSLPAA